MRSDLRAGLAAGIAAAVLAAAIAGARVRSPPPPEPELSGVARALLRRGMAHHLRSTDRLYQAAIRLHFEEARAAAQAVVDEPSWTPPDRAGPETLNAGVPPRFYLLQEKMRASARSVGAAAAKQDAKGLGASLGALAQDCIACHAAYLRR